MITRKTLRSACLTGLMLVLWEPTTMAGRGRQKLIRYAPATDLARGATLEDTTWKLETDTFNAELQRLNDEQRLSVIKHMSGIEIDPFAGKPDQPPTFQTFLVVIENHSEESLFFNTAKCWFVPNTAHLETPLDLQRMRSLFHTSQMEMPGAYERLGQVMLSGETLLQPGETLSGLLVYRFPSPRIKRFTVDLPLTLSRGDGVSFRAGWRRIKE